jgi:chromatin structure-remodeling complex subunit RSC4
MAGNLSGRLVASDFLKLPPRKRYPDYYQTIKKPIALDSIKEKIEKGEYEDVESSKVDLTLMTSNAKKYNLKESSIYLDAVMIQVPPLSLVLM